MTLQRRRGMRLDKGESPEQQDTTRPDLAPRGALQLRNCAACDRYTLCAFGDVDGKGDRYLCGRCRREARS